MTDCDELEASIDEQCSYNGTRMTEFTKKMKENGGDFTMSFWVKPTGANSLVKNFVGDPMFVPQVLMQDGRISCMHACMQTCARLCVRSPTHPQFYTQIYFYGKTSPPQANVGFGLYDTNINSGEVRVDSSCDRGNLWPFENVPLSQPASTSDWTFISVVRRNSSSPIVQTASNLLKFQEAAEQKLCLFDPESMINALEINYPMLISPIMLIPEAIPFANVQQTFLKARAKMASRNGPRLPKRNAKLENAIVVTKQDFSPRTVLIAPPIIFQVCVSAKSRAHVRSQSGVHVQQTRYDVI